MSVPVLQLTGIDNVTLNGTADIYAVFRHADDATPRTLSTVLRSRSFLPPVFEDAQFQPLTQPFRVYHIPAQTSLSTADYSVLVHKTFPVDGKEHTVTLTWDGDEYQMTARVIQFGRMTHAEWHGVFEFLDNRMLSTSESQTSSSPINVTGNVTAKPKIVITDVTSIERQRVTLADRTGHGYAALMQSIAPNSGGLNEDEYAVFANGLLIPHNKSGSRLYFYADGEANQSTYLDVYAGTAITNSRAGNLDTAGITLDSGIASGQYTTDPSQAPSNPLSPSLAWHLAPVVEHDNSREYTFGWDSDRLRLIDRDATGQRYQLDDDADAYVITSPVEIASISNLTFDVFAGYKQGRNEQTTVSTWQANTAYAVDDVVIPTQSNGHKYICITAGTSGSTEPSWPTSSGATVNDGSVRWRENGEVGKRVMRVIITTDDGDSTANGPVVTQTRMQSSAGVTYNEVKFPLARNNYLFYVQFTFGGVTFPNTWTDESGTTISTSAGNKVYTGTNYHNDYLPWELETLVNDWLPNVTVTTGDPGVYYLEFDEAAFRGVDLPLLSMSLQAKSGTWSEAGGDTLTIQGDTSINDLMLFDAEWVDPDTKLPFDELDDTDAPDAEESLIGQIKPFIKYWTRDAEQPTTAWSQVVSGTAPTGGTTSFSPSVDVSGAVKIAIGLEPVASKSNTINWGTLQITSSPTITLDSTKRPNVTVSSAINAQIVNGTLTNDTTGESIKFVDVYTDSNGLEIDTSNLGAAAIRGTGGTGPVYGQVLPTGGVLMFDLPPGNNEWSTTGVLSAGSVSFTWNEGLVV